MKNLCGKGGTAAKRESGGPNLKQARRHGVSSSEAKADCLQSSGCQ
jgi:hypothetical protein